MQEENKKTTISTVIFVIVFLISIKIIRIYLPQPFWLALVVALLIVFSILFLAGGVLSLVGYIKNKFNKRDTKTTLPNEEINETKLINNTDNLLVSNHRISKIAYKLCVTTIIIGASVFLVQFGFKLYHDQKELNYFVSKGKHWDWHNKKYHVQIAKNQNGTSVLRKVNFDKNYIIYVIKEQSSGIYKILTEYIIDCKPKTIIGTGWIDESSGKEEVLLCSEDGTSLYYEYYLSSMPPLFSEVVLSGFENKEDLHNWDFALLEREYLLKQAK
jgi:TM2 domain-containing membrane protein YozV